MLTLRNVQAGHAAMTVLRDLSLEVRQGEVAVLLGRNGAGKSTLLKTIAGLLPVQGGSIAFDGADITSLPPHRIARLGIGYVPEDRRIFTDLTVLENLDVGRQAPRAGAPHWTVERLFDLFPNLAEMRKRRGGQMSGGEQQMLTVARTLMGNPRLLLLDEPSEGLAPRIVAQMAAAIRTLKDSGLTVLLSEQNQHFAAAVGDQAHILAGGTLAASLSMVAFSDNPAISAAYLAV
jgi:branched-chain amino acid transport system ATP-binding protein